MAVEEKTSAFGWSAKPENLKIDPRAQMGDPGGSLQSSVELRTQKRAEETFICQFPPLRVWISAYDVPRRLRAAAIRTLVSKITWYILFRTHSLMVVAD